MLARRLLKVFSVLNMWPKTKKVVILTLLFAFPFLLLMKNVAINSTEVEIKSLTRSNYERRCNRGVDSDPMASCEIQQVVFAKVHKAASSTVFNILIRFSMSRELNVLFPLTGHINQSGTKIFQNNIVSLPEGEQFDILCNHLIFDAREIAAYLPKSAIYVAIVRDPFAQFVSAFKYYYAVWKVKYLTSAVKNNLEDPIRGFLQNPSKYDFKPPRHSYTNNRMSIDLGFPVEHFEDNKRNKTIIHKFLRKVEADFDLLLIADCFDESMVLLRRRLHWQTRDIIYIVSNEFDINKISKELSKDVWLRNKSYDSDVKELYSKWGNVDTELYNFIYHKIFTKEIKKQDKDFGEEVALYKKLLGLVDKYCKSNQKQTEDNLTVTQTKWWSPFTVTRQDCRLMQLKSNYMLQLSRRQQNRRNRQ